MANQLSVRMKSLLLWAWRSLSFGVKPGHEQPTGTVSPPEPALWTQYLSRYRELCIIHRTLTDPDYSYGCLQDADATTELTDLVDLLERSHRKALGTTSDATANHLLGSQWADAYCTTAPYCGPKDNRYLASSNARLGLQLHIIRSILTEPGYDYDVGSDADYTTKLTDLVNAVADAYRTAVNADADTALNDILQTHSNALPTEKTLS